MDKSETINELAMALSKAQGEMLPARMNATNPFLKNRYADLGSVIEAAKVACAKYGLSVTQPASTDGEAVTVTTILMHSSGQWISSGMTLPLGKESGRSIAQAAGSIITYLRRYSLAAVLGIYSDEDTDGSNEGKVKTEAKAKAQPAMPTGTEAIAHAAPMTLDKALLTRNRDGVLYGDLEDDKLSYMATSLAKIAKRTPDQESKLLAIQLIFASRQEHSEQSEDETDVQ